VTRTSPSAVAAEADRVGPGRRQTLPAWIDDEAQRLQRLDAQDGLLDLPDQYRGRCFTAVDPHHSHIGEHPDAPAVCQAYAHGPASLRPERARQTWRDHGEGRTGVDQHTGLYRSLRPKPDVLMNVAHRTAHASGADRPEQRESRPLKRAQPARARRTAPQKTSPIATSTATTAATKSRYIRLFAAPAPNSRPRPPKMGPMTDASTFPQAVAMSSHAIHRCARGPSASHGAAAATAISVRPFRMPSRCAIRQPRTSPGRWTPRAPGSGERTILPRMTKVKGNPATRPTMKTSAPFATSKARSLSAIVHSSPKKRRRAASSAGCSGPENGTSGMRVWSAAMRGNARARRSSAWGPTSMKTSANQPSTRWTAA